MLVFRGACPACQGEREFQFRLDRNARLFDPGEYLWLGTVADDAVEIPPGELEPEALHKARATLARSVDALEQVVAFVPANGLSVSAAAFTSALGQAMFRSNPEWFHRDHLNKLIAERRERLAVLDSWIAHHESQQRDHMPLARSYDEITLYQDLHPCRCGEAALNIERSSLLDLGNDVLGRHHEARCAGCGSPREFYFRLSDDILQNGLAAGRFGGPEPSELIDAGEWHWIAEMIVSRIPPFSIRLTPQQRAESIEDLQVAVAALKEVLKFIPPAEEMVPDEAFWTPRGRKVRAEELPFRFRRNMIQVRIDSYQKSLRQFES